MKSIKERQKGQYEDKKEYHKNPESQWWRTLRHKKRRWWYQHLITHLYHQQKIQFKIHSFNKWVTKTDSVNEEEEQAYD